MLLAAWIDLRIRAFLLVAVNYIFGVGLRCFRPWLLQTGAICLSGVSVKRAINRDTPGM